MLALPARAVAGVPRAAPSPAVDHAPWSCASPWPAGAACAAILVRVRRESWLMPRPPKAKPARSGGR